MIKNRDITIPFLLPWNWSADYQWQTCLTLATNNRVTVYYQHDAQFWLKRAFRPQRPKLPKHKNIHVYVPIYILPFQRFPAIRKLNEILALKLFAWHQRRQWQRAAHRPILWLFDQDFYFYPKVLPQLFSIYDCVDFHWHPKPTQNHQVRQQDTELIKNVELCVVNSQSLYEHHQRLRSDIHVVPQGFRLQNFTHSSTPAHGAPRCSVLLPHSKPIIGYVGALNHRLQFKLLFALIESSPHWQFVFWGPLQLKSNDAQLEKNIRKLSAYPNVTRGHSEDRHQVAEIIAQCDVCTIPYDTSQAFNKYCYPMKLLEYFYVGKPVIATPIKELQKFSDLVVIAKDWTEWQLQISQLLREHWPIAKQRAERQIAEANSWTAKLEAISVLLKH